MLTVWLECIFKKLGTSDTHCILHNSKESATVTLHLNLVFHIKLQWGILKFPQVLEFPDFSPSGMSVHFIPYRKGKISTVRK
jgi:hypothetical protein